VVLQRLEKAVSPPSGRRLAARPAPDAGGRRAYCGQTADVAACYAGRRDTANDTRPGSQLAGRFRSVWQVLGSNQRRLSRRFNRPLSFCTSQSAAYQRICAAQMRFSISYASMISE